jgi:hypothetical protein
MFGVTSRFFAGMCPIELQKQVWSVEYVQSPVTQTRVGRMPAERSVIGVDQGKATRPGMCPIELQKQVWSVEYVQLPIIHTDIGKIERMPSEQNLAGGDTGKTASSFGDARIESVGPE